MQSLWSNYAGACVMISATSITLTNPGTQKSTLGNAVILQIQVSSGSATSFTATGLPDGLSINRSTGLITGKPGITARTWHPSVIATGSGGTKISFT